MKDRTLYGKDEMSVTVFLQEFKSAFDACRIYESAVILLFKQFPTGPAEAAVKAKLKLTTSAKFHHDGALKS